MAGPFRAAQRYSRAPGFPLRPSHLKIRLRANPSSTGAMCSTSMLSDGASTRHGSSFPSTVTAPSPLMHLAVCLFALTSEDDVRPQGRERFVFNFRLGCEQKQCAASIQRESGEVLAREKLWRRHAAEVAAHIERRAASCEREHEQIGSTCTKARVARHRRRNTRSRSARPPSGFDAKQSERRRRTRTQGEEGKAGGAPVPGGQRTRRRLANGMTFPCFAPSVLGSVFVSPGEP